MSVSLADFLGRTTEIETAVSIILGVTVHRNVAINPTAGGVVVRMMNATGMKPGQWFILKNDSATNSFEVRDRPNDPIPDSAGNASTTVGPDEACIVRCISNADSPGKWITHVRSTASESTPQEPFGVCIGIDDGTDVNNVHYFNHINGTWYDTPDDWPQTVQFANNGDTATISVADTDLYVYGHASVGQTNEFHKFKLSTGAWTALATIPGNPSPLAKNYGFAALLGDSSKVYGLGQSGNPDGEDSNLYSYDITGDSWSQLSDFTQSLTRENYGCMNADASEGYVIRRLSEHGTYSFLLSTTVLTTEFSCPTNAWDESSYINDRPNARVYCVMGDTRIGGGESGPYSDQVWRFNTSTKLWDQLDSCPLDAKANCWTWLTAGLGYVAFGKIEGGDLVATTYIYNPISDSWVLGIDDPYADENESALTPDLGRELTGP